MLGVELAVAALAATGGAACSGDPGAAAGSGSTLDAFSMFESGNTVTVMDALSVSGSLGPGVTELRIATKLGEPIPITNITGLRAVQDVTTTVDKDYHGNRTGNLLGLNLDEAVDGTDAYVMPVMAFAIRGMVTVVIDQIPVLCDVYRQPTRAMVANCDMTKDQYCALRDRLGYAQALRCPQDGATTSPTSSGGSSGVGTAGTGGTAAAPDDQVAGTSVVPWSGGRPKQSYKGSGGKKLCQRTVQSIAKLALAGDGGSDGAPAASGGGAAGGAATGGSGGGATGGGGGSGGGGNTTSGGGAGTSAGGSGDNVNPDRGSRGSDSRGRNPGHDSIYDHSNQHENGYRGPLPGSEWYTKSEYNDCTT
jgi:hypothetical protein